jgi:hypothetical protein
MGVTRGGKGCEGWWKGCKCGVVKGERVERVAGERCGCGLVVGYVDNFRKLRLILYNYYFGYFLGYLFTYFC